MGISLGSSFDRQAAVPLDGLYTVADLTARNAIVAGVRYEGMQVYVESEQKCFYLRGGILDANWKKLGAGGSGGAGFIEWQEGGSSPMRSFRTLGSSPEFVIETFDFNQNTVINQCLFTTYVVPDDYEVGKQIFISGLKWSTPGTSGTARMRAAALLQTPGSSLVTSTTNQHGDTTSAVTVPGVANTLTDNTDLDITDATGQVNGVAVQPGDVLLITLFRGVDSCTSDLQVWRKSAFFVTAE